MADIEFFSQEWADAVREAINAEPDPDYKADKLELYWMWIDVAKGGLDITLALGCRDLGTWIVCDISGGECTGARTADELPDDVTFALSGSLEDWRDILSGFDTNKAVMYRKLRLERGDVFAFFDRVYFYTEALQRIAKIPTDTPAPVSA